MMKEEDIDTILKREAGHRELRQTFQQNPGPMIIKICDEEAKKVLTKVTDEGNSNNIRHYGVQVIMKEGQIASSPFK